jgi:hypothetical protein
MCTTGTQKCENVTMQKSKMRKCNNAKNQKCENVTMQKSENPKSENMKRRHIPTSRSFQFSHFEEYGMA